MFVLDENMTMPVTAKIGEVRSEFKRLEMSEIWLKNVSKLANGRECYRFTLKGESISHTYLIDDPKGRVMHIFQAGNMLTAECARFQPKAQG